MENDSNIHYPYCMVFLRAELLANSDSMTNKEKLDALLHLAGVAFTNGLWTVAVPYMAEVESALVDVKSEGVSDTDLLPKEFEYMWLRARCMRELGNYDECLDMVDKIKKVMGIASCC
jgi:hypothetical protein